MMDKLENITSAKPLIWSFWICSQCTIY